MLCNYDLKSVNYTFKAVATPYDNCTKKLNLKIKELDAPWPHGIPS